MKVVTYNIHRCIGIDGQYDPARIAHVLAEVGADIIGLQEVDTSLVIDWPTPSTVPIRDRRKSTSASTATISVSVPHQLDYLTQATGFSVVKGLIREVKAGYFGNVLLTSYKVLNVRQVDLTIRGSRQRRGALDVDLDLGGSSLRVFIAHLGLGLWERHFQVRRLMKALGPDHDSRVLMMGDFNLWVSLFPRLRRLHRRLGHVPLVTTYPSIYPLLSLDRIWLQPQYALRSVTPHNTPLSRLASDHLPLVGEIQF